MYTNINAIHWYFHRHGLTCFISSYIGNVTRLRQDVFDIFGEHFLRQVPVRPLCHGNVDKLAFGRPVLDDLVDHLMPSLRGVDLTTCY